MAKNDPRPLRVFIGCPGDMAPERAELLKLRDHLEALDCPVRFLIWKNATPGAGDAQKVIFENYPIKDWDIFIGLLWTRFGVPSGIKCSLSGEMLTGTESEFAGAYDAFIASAGRCPQILLYRCTRAIPVAKLDIHQYGGVQAFFKQTETGALRPALTQDFKTAKELTRRVVQDIVQAAERLRTSRKKPSRPGASVVSKTKSVDWAAEEERYRRHLIETNRIVKFHTAEARQPVEVELEKVFIKLTAHTRRDQFIYPRFNTEIESGERWRDDLFRRLNTLAHSDLPPANSLPSKDPLQAIYDWIALAGPAQEPSSPVSLSETLRQHPHLSLVGSPGAGKSTLLQYLVLTFASRAQQTRFALDEERLPLLIRLRQFYRWIEQQRHEKKLLELKPAHFHEFLEETWENESGAPKLESGFFRRLLTKSKALILLDGLDEVADPAQRRVIAALVAAALEGWREARVILTSRPRAWESEGRPALGERVGEAQLSDLDDAQVDEFVRHWYLASTIKTRGDTASARGHAESRAVDLIAAVKPERIHRLSATPLMLSILAMVHSRGVGLPQERSQLYHECIEFMLGYWDELAGLELDSELKEVAACDRATKRQILEPVALWMHRLGSAQVEPFHDDLVREFAKGFQSVLNESPGSAKRLARAFLRLIVERGGLMQESEAGQFRFVHLTFQEYLAASAIAHGEAPFDQVRAHLHDPWWREVILLAGGELSRQKSFRKKDDTTAWLEGIRDAGSWAEPWLLRDLQLAARCCADMTETGVTLATAHDLAHRVIDALVDRRELKLVADLGPMVREFRAGHFTQAIASILSKTPTRRGFSYLGAALTITPLLSPEVVPPALVAIFAAARKSPTPPIPWEATFLYLVHGAPRNRLTILSALRRIGQREGRTIGPIEIELLIPMNDEKLLEEVRAWWRGDLKSTRPNIVAFSAAMLVQHGPPADRQCGLEALTTGLLSDDESHFRLAADRLHSLGTRADAPMVQSALDHLLARQSDDAVELWGKIVGPRAQAADFAPLQALLADPGSPKWWASARVLLEHGDAASKTSIRAKVRARLNEENPNDVLFAAETLLRHDPKSDHAAIAARLSNTCSHWDIFDSLFFAQFAETVGDSIWNYPRLIKALLPDEEFEMRLHVRKLTALVRLRRVRPENARVSCPPVTKLANLVLDLAKSEAGRSVGSAVLAVLTELASFPDFRPALVVEKKGKSLSAKDGKKPNRQKESGRASRDKPRNRTST